MRQALGGGFGFGTSRTEKNCNVERWARWLERRGYRKAAVQLVINEIPMVRKALNGK